MPPAEHPQVLAGQEVRKAAGFTAVAERPRVHLGPLAQRNHFRAQHLCAGQAFRLHHYLSDCVPAPDDVRTTYVQEDHGLADAGQASDRQHGAGARSASGGRVRPVEHDAIFLL